MRVRPGDMGDNLVPKWRKVLPMCPVRSVSYLSGRSAGICAAASFSAARRRSSSILRRLKSMAAHARLFALTCQKGLWRSLCGRVCEELSKCVSSTVIWRASRNASKEPKARGATTTGKAGSPWQTVGATPPILRKFWNATAISSNAPSRKPHRHAAAEDRKCCAMTIRLGRIPAGVPSVPRRFHSSRCFGFFSH